MNLISEVCEVVDSAVMKAEKLGTAALRISTPAVNPSVTLAALLESSRLFLNLAIESWAL